MPDFDEIQEWIVRILREMGPQEKRFFGDYASRSLPFCLGHVFDRVDIVEVGPLAHIETDPSPIPLTDNVGMWLGQWQGRFFGLDGEVDPATLRARADRVAATWKELFKDQVVVENPMQVRVMPVREWNDTFGNLWQDSETHLINELRRSYQAFLAYRTLQDQTLQDPAPVAPPRRRI